jgi:hypothetical protein
MEMLMWWCSWTLNRTTRTITNGREAEGGWRMDLGGDTFSRTSHARTDDVTPKW